MVFDRAATGQTHCSVAVDDVLGGDLAATHLFDLGDKHIAFVGGPASIGQVRDRLEGVHLAAARACRPSDSVTHIATNALTINEGRSAAERTIGIAARRWPTAAFCANDMLVLGLLQQCVSLGLRVREDMAIVGYDGIELLDDYNNPEHEHQQVRPQRDLAEGWSTRHIIWNASMVGSTRAPKRYAAPGVCASSMTDPRLDGSWANLPKNRPSTEPRRGGSPGPALPP